MAYTNLSSYFFTTIQENYSRLYIGREITPLIYNFNFLNQERTKSNFFSKKAKNKNSNHVQFAVPDRVVTTSHNL